MCSMTADRECSDPAKRSTFANTSEESVIEVVLFIQTYERTNSLRFPTRRVNVNLPRVHYVIS